MTHWHAYSKSDITTRATTTTTTTTTTASNNNLILVELSISHNLLYQGRGLRWRRGRRGEGLPTNYRPSTNAIFGSSECSELYFYTILGRGGGGREEDLAHVNIGQLASTMPAIFHLMQHAEDIKLFSIKLKVSKVSAHQRIYPPKFYRPFCPHHLYSVRSYNWLSHRQQN